MNDLQPDQTDWVHLAANVEVRPLWCSLHDSTLVSCRSDLLARTVSMRYTSGYLVPGNSDAAVDLHLSEVMSSRATLLARWPGEYVQPKGMSREEDEPLLREYWSKWREQSLGWPDFEAMLGDNTFDVRDASLAIGHSTRALKVGGMLEGHTVDGLYCCVFVAFRSLSIEGPNKDDMKLEEFEQLGNTYWEEFARRAPAEGHRRT